MNKYERDAARLRGIACAFNIMIRLLRLAEGVLGWAINFLTKKEKD